MFIQAHIKIHQSSASLAFVRGIHRSPVNSPHNWPVTRKMFPFHDVIMCSNKVLNDSWWVLQDWEYFTHFSVVPVSIFLSIDFIVVICIVICITISYRYGFGYFKIFETSLDMEKSLLLILSGMFVVGSTIVEGNLKLCLDWTKYTKIVQIILLWLTNTNFGNIENMGGYWLMSKIGQTVWMVSISMCCCSLVFVKWTTCHFWLRKYK